MATTAMDATSDANALDAVLWMANASPMPMPAYVQYAYFYV
jgi:hypothetical protein